MQFIGTAKAQGIDGIASPTIPITPPVSITNTPAPGVTNAPTGPSILIESDNLDLQIGETSTVRILIDSKGIEISSYTVKISFDPSVVRVLDANATRANVQINYLHQFFDEVENLVLPQSGAISLSTLSPSGARTISNIIVAEFEVEAVANGQTSIFVSQQESLLVDGSSIDRLQATNEIAFVINSQQAEVTPTNIGVPPPTLPPGTTVAPTPPFLTGIVEVTPSEIPATALPGGWPSTIALGVVFVILGTYVLKLKPKNVARR